MPGLEMRIAATAHAFRLPLRTRAVVVAMRRDDVARWSVVDVSVPARMGPRLRSGSGPGIVPHPCMRRVMRCVRGFPGACVTGGSDRDPGRGRRAVADQEHRGGIRHEHGDRDEPGDHHHEKRKLQQRPRPDHAGNEPESACNPLMRRGRGGMSRSIPRCDGPLPIPSRPRPLAPGRVASFRPAPFSDRL